MGGPLPCVYRYNGPDDNLLVPNNADLAHAQGLTGKGVTVGVVDVAFDNANMRYSPLNGAVISYDTALQGFGFVDGIGDEYKLHFQFSSAHLAARSSAGFNGAIAPDVRMRWFGVCTSIHENCQYAPSASRHYVRTLLDYGDVRLINVSLGGHQVSTPDAGYWAALREHDALLVGSAGSENLDQPSPLWLLPSSSPDDYGYFIVAMSLHAGRDTDPWGGGENVSPVPHYEIYCASYSNACGIAAQWCVGAVANARIPDFDNPDILRWGAGTSGAAPVVTGVAALVLEAYPWMSASNLQQTVLTTATDIGAPGVDPVYGWGLVNARKAIDGPAQFVRNAYVDGFIADFEGESRPFLNDISGDGGLLKKGVGTLTLAGNNTYSGDTVIVAGTLRLTGSVASDIIVGDGAAFNGSGGVINADYLPQTGSETLIQLGQPLSVLGRVQIADGAWLRLLPEAHNYTVQRRELLITAGAIAGQFAGLRYGNDFFWQASLDYSATEVTTLLTRAQAQVKAVSMGAPASVVDGAGMADVLIGHTDGLVESGQSAGREPLIAAAAELMAASSNETAALSLSSLTGEIHNAARYLGIQRVLNHGERLADRMRAANVGVWVQSDSGNGALSRVGYGGLEARHGVLGIGVDERFGDVLTLGFAATRAWSNASLDGLGGRLSGSGQQMAVYARLQMGRAGYLTGMVNHDRHTIETQRRVLAGRTLNHVFGQHRDHATLVRVEGARRFRGGLTPYLAAGALSLRQGGMTESGVLGLTAGVNTLTYVFSEMGTRFDYKAGQWTWAGILSARWMARGQGAFNAAFAGAETASFEIPGLFPAHAKVRMGGDVGYWARNGLRFSFAFGAERGGGQWRNGWGEVAVEIGF